VGWYRVNPVAWNWWAPSSVAWSVGSLATAAAISAQVDQAIADYFQEVYSGEDCQMEADADLLL
jgi:hypothetical protein